MSNAKPAAHSDHKFIRLLQAIVDDPEKKEFYLKIKKIRNGLRNSRLNAEAIVTTNPGAVIPAANMPQDLKFALVSSFHNVDSAKMNRILKGNHIPNEGEVVRITQNFGMRPEEPATQEFIAAGIDYIAACKDRPHVQATLEIAPKSKASVRDVSDLSALAQELEKLRASRVSLKYQGFKIVHKDSQEAKGNKHQNVSMEDLSLRAKKIAIVMNDKATLKADDWERTIKPVLTYLNATPDEEEAISRAYGDRVLELKVSRGRK